MRDALGWLDSLQGSGIRPGLARMRVLLRTLGRPQEDFPSVIVAGTNGKGSTSATLTSIFNASGYRTGLYTSPHLVDIRERWQIGGENISRSLLAECIAAIRVAAGVSGITPTYFEALTLIAFVAFSRARCDMVVLEVGMGGRLDATNVVRPAAALITPIGFDHTEFLGKTIRKIAAEKAGVIHRGAIALTSNRDPVVVEVIRRRADAFDAPLLVTDRSRCRASAKTPLAGDFQRDNVCLAIRAAEELRPQFPQITPKTIAKGVADTRWRGRLERFEIEGRTVIVDGCHNAHAAREVAPYVARELPEPRLMVFGIMSDKDIADVTATLFPLFRRVIATEPYPPRSTVAADLVARAQELGVAAHGEPDPKRALALAMRSPERSIFVGGSLYLAGTAIEFFD